MSKETNKKTGLTKLEKENLGNVNGGYTIKTYDDGTIEVSGTVNPDVQIDDSVLVPVPAGWNDQRTAVKTFTSLTKARFWADKHLLRDPNPRKRQNPIVPLPTPHNGD